MNALYNQSEMEAEPFNPDFTNVDRVLDEVERPDPLTGDYQTFFLVKWCALPYEESTWEIESDVDIIKIGVFRKIRDTPPKTKYVARRHPDTWRPLKEPQTFLNGCSLRSYQVEGVSWLLFNFLQDRNCILADEMGLGKTVQSVTYLQHLRNQGIDGPFLVIAPLSTLGNWQREFELWTDMNVVMYHGGAASRDIIHTYDMYARDSKGRPIKNGYRGVLQKCHVKRRARASSWAFCDIFGQKSKFLKFVFRRAARTRRAVGKF